jgi:hypothetical protein
MARSLFTQEQVFEVADGMAAEGKEVRPWLCCPSLAAPLNVQDPCSP